jgi:Nif-specific regulatory protein
MSERKGTLKKLEEITYLYEIAKSLSGTIDLKQSLYSVLEILSKSLGMRRGTITILNPLRDEIQIQVAHGLSQSAMQRGKYKPGEGITGRVIQQGKAYLRAHQEGTAGGWCPECGPPLRRFLRSQ